MDIVNEGSGNDLLSSADTAVSCLDEVFVEAAPISLDSSAGLARSTMCEVVKVEYGLIGDIGDS